MLKFRKKLILAKIESTYGTDSAPGAADAVLIGNDVEFTPVAGDDAERDLVYPYYGSSGRIPINVHQTVAFGVELAGSGAKGTAPGWGLLLRACGMAEVKAANTKVDYNPITGSEESISLYYYLDGQLHKMTGVRGTFTLTIAKNAIPRLRFTMTSLWNDPNTAATPASPDFSKYKKPLIGSKANTPTFSLAGVATLPLASFEYNHGAEVSHREMINTATAVHITDRNATGTVLVDTPKYSALNLPLKARNADTGALSLVHGVGDGKIIEIAAPKFEFGRPGYEEDEGIWQSSVPGVFLPSSGNDEIKITAK